MGAPWQRVKPDTSCRLVLRLMREQGQPGVLAVDAGERLVGILNEGDLLRQMQPGATLDMPIDRILRGPVFTVRDHELLFHAIAIMRRIGVRRLPVLDREGRIAGDLTLEAALAAPMEHLLSLADQLSRGDTRQELETVKSSQATMARTLLEDGIPATEVQALLTEVNNDLYTRVVAFELESLADEGWGRPPIGFDAVVMGSGGRGESFLSPDQDNAFLLQDYADPEHGPIDAYFIELATRMCRMLDRIGIPYCRGHVMATNPLWRKHLGQWKAQLGYWLAYPNSAILRLADIFFDFSPVFGDGELSAKLRRLVTTKMTHQHAFLRAMQEVQDDHGVALGPLGRLAAEYPPGLRGGRVDVKYHGLLPLVEGVRLLALREGVAPCSTLARIVRLAESGVLSADERDYLTEAFGHLTGLLLAQQIRDLEVGQTAGNHISLQRTTTLEKAQLVDALKSIATFRARVHTEFTGEI